MESNTDFDDPKKGGLFSKSGKYLGRNRPVLV